MANNKYSLINILNNVITGQTAVCSSLIDTRNEKLNIVNPSGQGTLTIDNIFATNDISGVNIYNETINTKTITLYDGQDSASIEWWDNNTYRFHDGVLDVLNGGANFNGDVEINDGDLTVSGSTSIKNNLKANGNISGANIYANGVNLVTAKMDKVANHADQIVLLDGAAGNAKYSTAKLNLNSTLTNSTTLIPSQNVVSSFVDSKINTIPPIISNASSYIIKDGSFANHTVTLNRYNSKSPISIQGIAASGQITNSGSYNNSNGTITFTRKDGTTYSVTGLPKSGDISTASGYIISGGTFDFTNKQLKLKRFNGNNVDPIYLGSYLSSVNPSGTGTLTIDNIKATGIISANNIDLSVSGNIYEFNLAIATHCITLGNSNLLANEDWDMIATAQNSIVLGDENHLVYIDEDGAVNAKNCIVIGSKNYLADSMGTFNNALIIGNDFDAFYFKNLQNLKFVLGDSHMSNGPFNENISMQTLQGNYFDYSNLPDGDYQLVVGGGNSTNRKNIYTRDYNGNIWTAGNIIFNENISLSSSITQLSTTIAKKVNLDLSGNALISGNYYSTKEPYYYYTAFESNQTVFINKNYPVQTIELYNEGSSAATITLSLNQLDYDQKIFVELIINRLVTVEFNGQTLMSKAGTRYFTFMKLKTDQDTSIISVIKHSIAGEDDHNCYLTKSNPTGTGILTINNIKATENISGAAIYANGVNLATTKMDKLPGAATHIVVVSGNDGNAGDSGMTINKSGTLSNSQTVVPSQYVVSSAIKSVADKAIEVAGSNSITVTSSGINRTIAVKLASSNPGLKIDSTGLSSDLKLSKVGSDLSGYAAIYQLQDAAGHRFGDQINIPKDQFLKDAVFIPHATAADVAAAGGVIALNDPCIKFTFEIKTKDASGKQTSTEKVIYVNMKDLVDIYTGVSGVYVDKNTNQISGVIDPSSDTYFTLGANGFKVSGVSSAIETASGYIISGGTFDFTNKQLKLKRFNGNNVNPIYIGSYLSSVNPSGTGLFTITNIKANNNISGHAIYTDSIVLIDGDAGQYRYITASDGNFIFDSNCRY